MAWELYEGLGSNQLTIQFTDVFEHRNVTFDSNYATCMAGGRLALAQNAKDTPPGDSGGASLPVRLSRSTAHSTEMYHLEGVLHSETKVDAQSYHVHSSAPQNLESQSHLVGISMIMVESDLNVCCCRGTGGRDSGGASAHTTSSS